MNRVYQAIFRNAGAVITHSAGARDTLVKEFPEDTGRFHIIPHGDLSQTLPPLTSRDAARDALKVSSAPFCLMFGAIEPYKGIEEVIRFWNTCSPPLRLVVAGRVSNPDYEKTLRAMAGANPEIEFRFGWLSDSELSHWLSAADVVLFNYRTILTSGAACLARYVGVPVVLPDRLTTVDLDEPHPYVLRFQNLDDSLTQKLREAVHLSRNAAVAEKWRERTSWSEIAKQTAAAYHAALGQR